jgi:hypothetical protein
MLEEIEIQGQGFRPLKDYGAWRIARLSYDADWKNLCHRLPRLRLMEGQIGRR